jgi:leucyl aminopeptidase
MALIVDQPAPKLLQIPRLSATALASCEACVVLVPITAKSAAFAALPAAARWRELHARAPAKAATVRSSAVGNKRHTLMVLGYYDSAASPFQLLTIAARAIKEAVGRKPARLALVGPSNAAASAALSSAALAAAYAMPHYRSGKPAPAPLREILVVGAQAAQLQSVRIAARANNLARALTALPSNKLTASSYRAEIAARVRGRGITLRWLSETKLAALGAGAFLAVSAGNAERDAGIMHLSYRPANRKQLAPDIALVGKGILFDTGGNNLKPHRGMLDMHHDMSGSAVALATLLALAEQRSPLAIDCWLAITENCIGPRAYRPQDVVRAVNGTTIQVIHTDAEGRMVLADTLALAGRSKPRLIIDFATLTGAAVYSLTERMGAVFTNRPAIEPLLLAAGRTSGERVWPFPMDEDYDSDLDSKIADIMQCSVDGKGDHILAARFLRRFVPDGSAWVHLDLAAATRAGGLGAIPTDVTGFGVFFALELIVGQRVLDSLTSTGSHA